MVGREEERREGESMTRRKKRGFDSPYVMVQRVKQPGKHSPSDKHPPC